jgi:hypothetical protein
MEQAALSHGWPGALSCLLSDFLPHFGEEALLVSGNTPRLDETWLLADFAWDPVAMARAPATLCVACRV